MEYKIGDYVHYFAYGKNENGRIKAPGYLGMFFVVYHCDNDWENYMNYTGQITSVNDLKHGWVDSAGDLLHPHLQPINN